MGISDIAIIGCTPNITIRANIYRSGHIQRARCSSQFRSGNQIGPRLSNIAGRCNLFSKLLRPTTGDNSLYRFVLDVVHPVCGLERQRFDVLDLFGDDGLHHLAHRSAFHKIAELATDVLAVLPPNFLVLPG